MKFTKYVFFECIFMCETCIFLLFMEFPKSGVPIRNRVLDAFLKSNYNKKHQIGKLRVRAFQRLKNQRLTTSPSRVMAIWKFYKILKIVRKCIKFNNNLVVNGRRFGGQRPFTKWIFFQLCRRPSSVLPRRSTS